MAGTKDQAPPASAPPKPGSARYPGLDSLRGLAVAAVVAYHLGWISGGFLGVDVFFVLSGFLITSLLLQEATGTGRIHLGAFWTRRAKRLAPAVMVMVPVVLFTAVVLGWPETARRSLAIDGFSALTWWANWRHLAEGGYWAPEPRVFVHTWSLAIEEQFYLFWPLLLVAATTVARRLRAPTRWGVGLVAAVGALASFAWASVLAHRLAAPDLSRIYLGTDTRVGTPLVGCLLACLLYGRVTTEPSRKAQAIAAGVGGAAAVALGWMIVHASVEDPRLYRNGWLPAAALLGAVLLRCSMALPRTDPVTRYLGLRSYAIYLWSWPVQILAAWHWPGIGRGKLTVGVLVAVLVLAEVSHRLVESPVRFGTGWASRPRRLLPAGGLVAASIGAAFVLVLTTAEPLPVYAQFSDDELAAKVLSDDAPVTTGDGLRVMLAGDSVPFALGESLEPADFGPGIGSVDNRALPKCGILHWGQPDILRLGKEALAADLTDPEVYAEFYDAQRADPACIAQLDGEKVGLAAKPDVVVLEPGAREWGLAWADGKRVGPRDTGMAALVQESLLVRARMADEVGARTVIIEWACPGSAWAGPTDGPDYTRWMNQVIGDTVAAGEAEGLDIAIIEATDDICVGGDPMAAPTEATEAARPDGIHVRSADGAAYIWSWLGPAIVASGA